MSARVTHYAYGPISNRTACGLDINRPKPGLRYVYGATEEHRTTCGRCRRRHRIASTPTAEQGR